MGDIVFSYVCDVPASECTTWATDNCQYVTLHNGGSKFSSTSHCHAVTPTTTVQGYSQFDSSYWTSLRNKEKQNRAKKAKEEEAAAKRDKAMKALAAQLKKVKTAFDCKVSTKTFSKLSPFNTH